MIYPSLVINFLIPSFEEMFNEEETIQVDVNAFESLQR